MWYEKSYMIKNYYDFEGVNFLVGYWRVFLGILCMKFLIFDIKCKFIYD